MKTKLYRRHSADQILDRARAIRAGKEHKIEKGEIRVLELGNITISLRGPVGPPTFLMWSNRLFDLEVWIGKPYKRGLQ